MHVASFVDTNIWVYAHLQMATEPKHPVALALVKRLRNGVISPQVVAEYYNVMLRNGKDNTWIQTNLRTMLGYTLLQSITPPDTRKGSKQGLPRISYRLTPSTPPGSDV